METPESVLEQVPEDLKDWKAEDREWLAKVQPEGLQLIARRYGRAVFVLTMHAGAIQQGILNIERQTRGNRRVGQALMVISQAFNDTCLSALQGNGKEGKDLMNCRQDIERVASLMQGAKAPGDRVSKGGIILNS